MQCIQIFFKGKSAQIEAIGNNFKKVLRRVLRFKTRDDIQFIKCVVVNTASPYKYFGTLMGKSKALATSRRCLFFLSAIPFCWSELTHVL